MKQLFISLSVLLLFLSACNTEAIEPEFKRLEEIEIIDLSSDNVSISADAIIYNPNPISIYLTQIEITILANGIEVSHISQTAETLIAKKEEFPIPLNASFNPSQIFKENLIDVFLSGIDMFLNKKINITYKGYVKVKVLDIEFEIPIDIDDTIVLEENE